MLVHRKINHTINTKYIRWTNVLEIWWKDCGQSRDTWTLTKKTLDVQPDKKKIPHETFNTNSKTTQWNECQNLCLYNNENIWDSEEENIIDIKVWKKCDHCKGHHELYLNYNSENSSSSWADMMEKKLKWNKQQNLDDENQKTIHNIGFLKKNTPCSNGPLPLGYCKSKNGYRRKIKPF